ncbi:MAG: 50S ribosomal protein L22 [Patescibacteria group bacterium]
MKIIAKLNYLRLSPRKVRLVTQALRGKSLPEAERTLRFLTRRAAFPLLKLLRSAAANARHNFRINTPETLVISDIRVDEGPTLKRRRARWHGLAFPIRKRTSHVTVVLESLEKLPSRLRPRKSEIAVVRGDKMEKGVPADVEREERETLKTTGHRARPKVATKPRDFIQRLFRRKAI